MATRYPWFVRRDLDGFFGLFIDNLIQLLLIVQLCGSLCGMSGPAALFLTQHILPGAAISILLGNLFYAWQARELGLRKGRDDITALPYGINTPSLLVYVFFVMGPAYTHATTVDHLPQMDAARRAWEMGLLACFGSGFIELSGAFFAAYVRKYTPRAALLSTLAGIAIGFISMGFLFQIFQKPLITMLPLAFVLITYFSNVPLPLKLPGGLIAVVLGTATAWLLTVLVKYWPDAPTWVADSTMSVENVTRSWESAGFCLPQFSGDVIRKILKNPQQWIGLLSVIVPMGLFNLIGSLQNIESAEAAGDQFDTQSSLAVNGVGTILASFFGSCFPTTIYIGHPGWKQLGARAGYSILNGVVVTIICLTGTVGIVNALVPMQAGIAIVLWIGVIITAQAFAATQQNHAPAVAIGLFPAIAAWGMTVVHGTFFLTGGKTLQDVLVENPGVEANGFLVHGLLTVERGYIFSCVILAALSAKLIDRRFVEAAGWAAGGAIFAITGLTHAYQVSGNSIDFLFPWTKVPETALVFRGTSIAIGYAMMSFAFLLFAWYRSTLPANLRHSRTHSHDRMPDETR